MFTKTQVQRFQSVGREYSCRVTIIYLNEKANTIFK
jgi:hypothetical protein